LIPDEEVGIVILTNGMRGIYSTLINYTVVAYLQAPEKDWSTEALLRQRNFPDTRVQERRNARIPGTKPTLALDKYAGEYFAPTYGNISVKLNNGRLALSFEHTPDLSATLEHWHKDVWEIKWDNPEV